MKIRKMAHAFFVRVSHLLEDDEMDDAKKYDFHSSDYDRNQSNPDTVEIEKNILEDLEKKYFDSISMLENKIDIASRNIEKINEILPNLIEKSSIDDEKSKMKYEKLKNELSIDIEKSKGKLSSVDFFGITLLVHIIIVLIYAFIISIVF